MEHLCHAHDCKVPVRPSMFMCRPHWYSLRKELRDAVWREYEAGQQISKRPSARYCAVQRLAIAEVAFKADDEVAARTAAYHLLYAERWRQRSINGGFGDPFDGLVDRR